MCIYFPKWLINIGKSEAIPFLLRPQKGMCVYREWLYGRRVGWGGGDFINQNMGFDHDSRNAKLQINSSSVEVNLPYWHNASTYICIYKAILFALLLIFTS